MTYDRVDIANHKHTLGGAVVSHLAELVRGYFLNTLKKGPLIRPSC